MASCEMFWRRDGGIESREQVVARLVIYFLGKGSCKVISSEGGKRGRVRRGEERKGPRE